jgi:Ca-activated chloride channel family protein
MKTFLFILLFSVSIFADGMIIMPGPVPTPLDINYHKVDVNITEQVATTRVDQEFENSTDSTFTDGRYVFPIPRGAVITDFSIEEDGQMVSGDLLSKEEAREIYLTAVNASGDPALLEYSERGAYALSIGNMTPGSKKRISITYSEILTQRNGVCEYLYPLNTEKFSRKLIDSVSLHVDIHSSSPILNVYSPSHKIAVSRENEYSAVVDYLETRTRPGIDFRLFYSMSPEDFGLNLLTYNTEEEDGYFIAMLAPQYRVNTTIVPKDIAFVIDRSGSMSGNKIVQARDALTFCLNNINESDNYNIVSFNSSIDTLEPSLVPYSSSNLQKALTYVQGLTATGGTNINDALLTGLSFMNMDDRPNYIIFLTDGQATSGITATELITENVRNANTTDTRLFIFGVGYNVNTQLLDKLSSENNGISVYVNETQNIEIAISDFYKSISTPLLTDIEIDFGNISTYHIFPEILPDIFRGSQMVLSGRYSGSGSVIISLTGNINGNIRTFEYGANFPALQTDYAFVPKLWASKMVAYFLERIRLDSLTTDQKDSLVEEIRILSLKHGIVTPYTSYLFTDPGASNEQLYSQTDSVYGAGAFDMAASNNAWKNEGQVINYQAEVIKNIYPKTFVLDSNGVWVDQDYRQGDPLENIKFGSDEYTHLLVNNSGIGQFMSVGKNMILEWNGQSLFINDDQISVEDKDQEIQAQTLNVEVQPNPFSRSIAISSWQLAVGKIDIKIFNIHGKQIAKLTTNSQQLKAGIHWNASGLASGIYILKVTVGKKHLSRKLLLTR